MSGQRNTGDEAARVVDRFGMNLIGQAQQVINDTRRGHPHDRTCPCEAMEVLGLLLREKAIT